MPKSLAPKELVKIFEGKERVVLPAWDPMVRTPFVGPNSVLIPARHELGCPGLVDQIIGRLDCSRETCTSFNTGIEGYIDYSSKCEAMLYKNKMKNIAQHEAIDSVYEKLGSSDRIRRPPCRLWASSTG